VKNSGVNNNSQRGVTLIELLVVMTIYGLLAITFIELFRIAMISWNSASTHAQFLMNARKLISSVSVDTHEAYRFQKDKNEQLVLFKKHAKVRYSINQDASKITILRETKSNTEANWIPAPEFPIAEFMITKKNFIPIITFSKASAVELQLRIKNEQSQVETSICSRSAF